MNALDPFALHVRVFLFSLVRASVTIGNVLILFERK